MSSRRTDRQDVPDALRYYHNALYAPWPVDRTNDRRSVRLELIRFLLSENEKNRADSELVALVNDLPPDARLRVQAGQLLLRAGDDSHALEQFRQALQLEPADADALAGAGLAAFHLGDYAAAGEYLAGAPGDAPEVGETRELVELILVDDPLAGRISSAARRQRLSDDLEHAEARLEGCGAPSPGGTAATDRTAIADEARRFQSELPRGPLEQDTIEDGLELLDRMERLIQESCGPPQQLDRALSAIARRRGAARR
jgi:tetratricopeptide (TPR) repeat protein